MSHEPKQNKNNRYSIFDIYDNRYTYLYMHLSISSNCSSELMKYCLSARPPYYAAVQVITCVKVRLLPVSTGAMVFSLQNLQHFNSVWNCSKFLNQNFKKFFYAKNLHQRDTYLRKQVPVVLVIEMVNKYDIFILIFALLLL